MLFLDDAYVAQVSKDKRKLNKIIKIQSIAHVTFLFFFEIHSLFTNFILEEKLLLPFTRDGNNCR